MHFLYKYALAAHVLNQHLTLYLPLLFIKFVCPHLFCMTLSCCAQCMCSYPWTFGTEHAVARHGASRLSRVVHFSLKFRLERWLYCFSALWQWYCITQNSQQSMVFAPSTVKHQDLYCPLVCRVHPPSHVLVTCNPCIMHVRHSSAAAACLVRSSSCIAASMHAWLLPSGWSILHHK